MPVPASLWSELTAAASADPFLVVATGVFGLAVMHAFAAPMFARAAHRLEAAHAAHVAAGGAPVNEHGESSDFRAAVLHLLGEVEAVFGLWAFALFALMVAGRARDGLSPAATRKAAITPSPSARVPPVRPSSSSPCSSSSSWRWLRRARW